MRSCEKPRDPSSSRMIQIRSRDRGYVANSCSKQKAQSLDLLRVCPRTSATESFFASWMGVQGEYNIQVRWGYGTLGHQDCKTGDGLGVGDTHLDKSNVHVNWYDQGGC